MYECMVEVFFDSHTCFDVTRLSGIQANLSHHLSMIHFAWRAIAHQISISTTESNTYAVIEFGSKKQNKCVTIIFRCLGSAESKSALSFVLTVKVLLLLAIYLLVFAKYSTFSWHFGISFQISRESMPIGWYFIDFMEIDRNMPIW